MRGSCGLSSFLSFVTSMKEANPVRVLHQGHFGTVTGIDRNQGKPQSSLAKDVTVV